MQPVGLFSCICQLGCLADDSDHIQTTRTRRPPLRAGYLQISLLNLVLCQAISRKTGSDNQTGMWSELSPHKEKRIIWDTIHTPTKSHL